MNPTAIMLAKAVIIWWRDAQYWEAYPGKNRFDEDPVFVTAAFGVLDEANVDYGEFMAHAENTL